MNAKLEGPNVLTRSANALICAGVLALFLSTVAAGAAQPGRFESRPDGRGRTEYAPARIVSLAPSITEMIFALGAEENLIGVTTYDKFPPEARLKPKVGGFINPNYEVIITMRPTVVLMLPIHRGMEDKFSMLGIRTVVVNDNRVEDILASILKIGEITGKESEAHLLVSRLRREESVVMSSHRPEGRPKVMVVVSRQKGTLRSVFVAGGNTLFDDLVGKAGGENVFADSKASYPMVSPEQIVHKNPDVIIHIEMVKSASQGGAAVMLKDWEALSIVSAVRNGRDYQINEDYASVPGPRYILLLKKFAEFINSAQTGR